jgi:hypothetical protein
MFAQPRSSNRSWNASLLVSLVLHCVTIYFLVRPPLPIYVTPSQLAFGHGGTSTELIYLARHGSAAARASEAKPERKQIALNRKAPRTPPSPARRLRRRRMSSRLPRPTSPRAPVRRMGRWHKA